MLPPSLITAECMNVRLAGTGRRRANIQEPLRCRSLRTSLGFPFLGAGTRATSKSELKTGNRIRMGDGEEAKSIKRLEGKIRRGRVITRYQHIGYHFTAASEEFFRTIDK